MRQAVAIDVDDGRRERGGGRNNWIKQGAERNIGEGIYTYCTASCRRQIAILNLGVVVAKPSGEQKFRHWLKFGINFKSVTAHITCIDEAVCVDPATNGGELCVLEIIIKAVGVEPALAIRKFGFDACFIRGDRFGATNRHTRFKWRRSGRREEDTPLDAWRTITTRNAGIEAHIVSRLVIGRNIPSDIVIFDRAVDGAKRVLEEVRKLRIATADNAVSALVIIITRAAREAKLIGELVGERTEDAVCLALLALINGNIDPADGIIRITKR